MYTASKLRNEIIIPVLKDLDGNAPNMENLLFGTCAHESKMGRYLKQLGGGPAVGLYGMEPNTYKDLWTNYLSYRKNLAQEVLKIDCNNVENLINNPKFATAMAYVHYKRVYERLPSASDIQGLAQYWKKYYNTSLGKGTIAQFVEDYNNAQEDKL